MTPSVEQSLERVSHLLSKVIGAAESGDWDQLESLAHDFTEVAGGLNTAERVSFNPEDQAAIQTLLLQHEHAIQLCQERLQQIAPLVRALSPSKPESTER